MSGSARLIIASSERDSNLFYTTRFMVPDPVVYFEIGGKKHLVVSDLEIDRAKVQADVHFIHSLTDISKKLKRTKRTLTTPVYGLVVDTFFKAKGIREVIVPTDFPAIYFEALQKLGYRMVIKADPFYEQRLVKTLEEKKHIVHAIRQVEKTLGEVVVMLQKATIKGKRVYTGKEVVTSQMLQSIINTKLMERGCVGNHTIVASGVQGSLPHHHGEGPIVPHTPIIFDIFPQHAESRYYADMTRTMVKGKPTDMVKKMYAAVKRANEEAMEKIKHGVDSSVVHAAAAQCLERLGFKTGKNKAGRMEGFIHSTGHGLGLDVHEPPSVSSRGSILKKGYVVTVEPGLYYEKHGGIRLEDDVYVTAKGFEKLTRFPKFLEIDR